MIKKKNYRTKKSGSENRSFTYLFFSFLLAFLVPMAGVAQEPYAVLSSDNSVLTFYYDDQKAARNGMDIGPFWRSNYQSWYWQRESITNVVFDDSFAGCTTLTSTAYWFDRLQNLSSITGISNLKTDNVKDMSEMFSNCSSLTSLDVTGFKTDKVEYMSYIFYNCSGLTSLDVTGFKTDKVENMAGMFCGCRGLTSLDVTGFKTDNVRSMGYMFSGCSGLTSLDVTGFKTDLVTWMTGMFSGCSGLTSLDVTGFKTDNVTEMVFMFSDCSGLTSLDLSGFKTNNVKDMRNMFEGCSGLTTIYAGVGWSTAKVTYGEDIFAGCTSLVGGAGTLWDESHTDYAYARIDGGSGKPGYFTRKDSFAEQSEGDINGDGMVGSDDVMILVSVMMGGDKDKLADADLNHDGKVNVADVVVLINMITTRK